MGRNRPKEGKIVDKMHFFLQTLANLTSIPSKKNGYWYYLSLAYYVVHRVTSGSGATSKTILTRCHAYEKARFARAHTSARPSLHELSRIGTHTHAYTSTRAPSNSDVVFLLSQVSHWIVFSPPFLRIFPTTFPKKSTPLQTTFWGMNAL